MSLCYYGMNLLNRAVFPWCFLIAFYLLANGMYGFTKPLCSFKILTKIFTKAILDNMPQAFRLTYHSLLEIVSVLKKEYFHSSFMLDNFTVLCLLHQEVLH